MQPVLTEIAQDGFRPEGLDQEFIGKMSIENESYFELLAGSANPLYITPSINHHPEMSETVFLVVKPGETNVLPVWSLLGHAYCKFMERYV